MTKIIGHRGARGVELENSLASFKAALESGVDGIEFDVHLTRDNKLVVMHDATTRRVADKDIRINESTYAELQALHLKNGQQIPTLEEVLEVVGERLVYIDIKDNGCAVVLAQILHTRPKTHAAFASSITSELKQLRKLLPEAETYLYSLKAQTIIPRPIKIVHVAKYVGATGIGVDKLFLNPLTYFLARRSGLKIYTYSVGTRTLARFFKLLYPQIDLCTSHPERLVGHL